MADKKTRDPGFKEWLGDLKRDVANTQDAEVKAAWEKVLAGDEEDLRKVFRGGIREKKLYDELNKLNEERTAFQASRQEWDKYETDFRAEYGRMESEVKALKEDLKNKEKSFRAAGLEDEADELAARRKAVSDNIDSENIKKELSELRSFKATAEKQLGQLSVGAPAFTATFSKYARKFDKEGFVFDEEKVLGKVLNGTPVEQAFEDEVAPQREEKRKAETEKEISRRVEEAKKEMQTRTSTLDGIRPTVGIFGSEGTSKPGSKLLEARNAALKIAAGFGQPAAAA